MTEGEDDKPQTPASVPPPAAPASNTGARAEHAARKLGFRTSGRHDRPSDPKSEPTIDPLDDEESAVPIEDLEIKPGDPLIDPEDAPAPLIHAAPVVSGAAAAPDAAASARDARYAARRSLVAGEVAPEQPAAKPAKKKTSLKSPVVLVGIALAVIALLVGGTIVGLRMRYDSSDEGRVRGRLSDVEFAVRDTIARDNAWAEIDSMPRGPATAVQLLTDTQTAEKGSSHSTKKMQELANQYLLHLASTKKVDPPPKAQEMVKLLFDGQNPTTDQWRALQAAWKAWLDGKK